MRERKEKEAFFLDQYFRFIYGKNIHWKSTVCQVLAIDDTTVTKISLPHEDFPSTTEETQLTNTET